MDLSLYWHCKGNVHSQTSLVCLFVLFALHPSTLQWTQPFPSLSVLLFLTPINHPCTHQETETVPMHAHTYTHTPSSLHWPFFLYNLGKQSDPNPAVVLPQLWHRPWVSQPAQIQFHSSVWAGRGHTTIRKLLNDQPMTHALIIVHCKGSTANECTTSQLCKFRAVHAW